MDVSVYNAKTHLSQLIDRAIAGEEIVITRHGRPVAKLVKAEATKQPRQLGPLRGQIWISDDFDAPLPDDIRKAFEDPD